MEKTEDMLNRFFEGRTSGEEEQALYRFFRRDDVPAHLARYKPVFEYFETGLAQERAATPVAAKRRMPRMYPTRRICLAGLAAAVLAGCLFYFPYRTADDFDPYEGSYIVRNGVRITDTKLIRHELERISGETLRQEADMERMIDELTKDPDDAFDRYRLAAMQRRNAILNSFTDPHARREAEKILTADYD
ncbi:MAG: hypothetical protein LBJ23_08040 [Tannerella sp.]|jgi:hypothetical protein|nr:hypothetical protein [Tannerella sp.]